MTNKLQEAIDATRNGNTKQAIRLLTEILKENPDETHAWFLLSHLVDSPSKKMAYLRKVLALDPEHPKARQRLAYLQAVEQESTSEPEVHLAPQPVQEAVEIPLPTNELMEDTWLDESMFTETAETPTTPTMTPPPTKVPSSTPSPATTATQSTTKTTKITQAPHATTPPDLSRKQAMLNRTLYLLILLTLITLILFLYLLLNNGL
ncbi:MAG: hypothetical protein D6706_13405 [Chloroflexi bacterium]|nr:MAG: hypothetical protein D6706_13405 [Chloroflexota bacterium]